MVEDLSFLRDHKIEVVSIESIKPYEGNIKKHPEAQIERIVKSIQQYGYVQPIVVDINNVIIIGHGRYEALKRLGVKKIPVIRANLTEAEARALRIADNRLADLAIWDEGALKVELEYLKETGSLEILEVGFTDKEIEKFLQWIEDFDPSEKPASVCAGSKTETITREGDIWHLGKHKLICGDSTKIETYEKLLKNEKVNTVITSPPYAEQRKEEYGGIPEDIYPEWFEKVADCIYEYLADDGSMFVNIREHSSDGERSLYFYETIFRLRAKGWKYIDDFIWVKTTPFPSHSNNRLKGAYENVFWLAKAPEVALAIWLLDEPALEDLESKLIDTELIIDSYEKIIHLSKSIKIKFYPRKAGKVSEQVIWNDIKGLAGGRSSNGNVGVRKLAKTYKRGVALPSNVVFFHPNNEHWGHPAMFPVELPAFFIRLTTLENDIILDPFNGAGTTLVACEKLGRIYRGIDLKPEYCDITVRRYISLTGDTKNIYLERDGELVHFNELAL